MATKNKAAAAAPAAPAVDRDQEHIAALGRRRVVEADDAPAPEDTSPVMVKVPKAFRLHHPAGTITPYEAGVYEMPAHHAAHVYSVANGVVPHKGQRG